MNKIIIEKDKLIKNIKNIKNNFNNGKEEQINKFKNDITVLEEQNKNLIEKNKKLKKSNTDIIKNNKIKKLEKQNSINSENIISTKAKKIIAKSVNSAELKDQKNDINYLAIKGRKKNNSENMKIDFPRNNNINEKYEKLKAALKKIKEKFNEIKLRIHIDETSVNYKFNRISYLL